MEQGLPLLRVLRLEANKGENMDRIIRDKWITKLRSGEYKQGEDYLRKVEFDENGNRLGDQFCCLGVLCEMAAEEGVIPDAEILDAQFYYYGPAVQMPSSRAYSWAGLTAEEGDKLAEMNDDGQSFESIAEFIETNL